MNKSYLMAVSVSLAFILWMLAGLIWGDEAGNVDNDSDSTSAPMIVEAMVMDAQLITSYVVAQGSIIPNREVVLRAETAGQIEELLAVEGGYINAGSNVMKLDMDDRSIRREQAEIKLLEQQRQYKAVESLIDQGFSSSTELDTALLDLKMAEVDIAIIDLEIEKTIIKAPFSGIIEENHVDLGEFVSVGNQLVTIVDNNPLIVNAYISQNDIDYLDVSLMVKTTLVNGQEKMGTIRFISPRADEATRSFRVEIAIPNDEGLRAGSSATAFIPREKVKAHFVSAALLTLNDAGEVGIKTVDAEGLVAFFPVSIVSSDTAGMWVSGLPDHARLITSGQGFAQIGKKVTVSLSSSANNEPTSSLDDNREY